MKVPAGQYLLPLLFLLPVFQGKSQLFSDYHFRFKTYTTSEGLAHNSVKKCVSDSRGFLWCITENGLSRFDGFQFKTYRNIFNDSTSLPVNNLWDIAVTDKDEIIIAYKFGLCRMNPLSGRFSIIRHLGKNIEAERITFHKPTNTVFIATRNGILKYSPHDQTVTATSLHRKFQNLVSNITIDLKDNLWVLVERHGYYRYSIKQDTSFYYDSYDWPMHLYQDTEGTYYLGTWGNGFQVFDKTADEYHKTIHDLKLSEVPGNNYIFCGAAEAPLLTGTDIIWVISHVSGIGLYSKSEKRFVKHFGYNPSQKNGLATPFNWSIYPAPDGNLWIGTWHGLMKISPLNQYFQNAELPELHSSLYNAITGIIDDPYETNTAWMAVLGNGIAKYDKQTNQIIRRYYFDGLNVNAWYNERWPVFFHKDSNQVIWSSTYGGLIKISGGKVSFVPLSDEGENSYAESGIMDSRGNIWQTGDRIIQFNPYSGKARPWKFPWVKKSGLYGYGACEGADGKIYIASEWGLFTIDEKNDKTDQVHYSFPAGDSTKWSAVYSVQAIDNNIYFGTNAGLAAYNILSKKTEIISAEKNLKPVLKNALYRDKKNNLWIYCSSGLFRYNPSTKELLQFTTADGVYAHSNDPAYFFEYNGNTYLGSRMAYTRFNPGYISSNSNKPVPYITTAILNNGTAPPLPVSDGDRLNHRQQNISFDFTAIEYNFPEKITFSVMLEGFDETWSQPSPARTKSYTNLPPGKYTFKVRAFNNNKEGDAVASFGFSIKPAFWQTVWFKVLLSIVITGLVFFLYSIRIRQIKNRQLEKNRMQQLKLEQYRQELETEQISNFFSASLTGKENISEVLTDVAKNLIGKMGFEDCMIYLWNEDKSKLIQHAGHGVKGAIENTADKEKYHIPAGKGIVGAAVESRQPLLVNDTSADPRYISADEIIRRSELCVPVMIDDEVMGAINIEHTEKNFFTKHHIQTVSTIATLMANKIKAIESTSALHQKQLELAQASKQLAESEVAMLRSQMNPHFIFNSLNSVQKYIWENKEEDAAEYLASFAKLMRGILENSRYKFISLRKETEFLKLYIDLENRRSNNSFNYVIKLDESLDTAKTLIPPMLLQPFIENAIWHGLNKKAEKGNLLVHIYKKAEQLVCVVDDDGVGRQPSANKEGDKKSLGISITQQRIERLIEGASQSASLTIHDKTENGKPSGTIVTVILPLQTDPDA